MKIKDHDCKYTGHVEGEYTVPGYRVFVCNNCEDRFAIFDIDESSMENDHNLKDMPCEERKKLKMIKDIIE